MKHGSVIYSLTTNGTVLVVDESSNKKIKRTLSYCYDLLLDNFIMI